MKICKTCKKEQSKEEYYKHQHTKDRLQTECKQCYYMRKRKHSYKRMYGITIEEYDKCMETSDSCQICGSTDKLVYDHDHDTMKFRGVLCNKCNRGIGILGDTIEDIAKVLDYLNNK